MRRRTSSQPLQGELVLHRSDTRYPADHVGGMRLGFRVLDLSAQGHHAVVRAHLDGRVLELRVLEEPLPDGGLDPVVLRVDHLRSEEHTSELQSRGHLVCRLLLEKKKKYKSLY